MPWLAYSHFAPSRFRSGNLPALIQAASLATLAACTPPPLVHSTHLAETAIAREISIGVMVLYHERCAEHREKSGANCAPADVTVDINSQYARCVGSAFADSHDRITIVPGDVIHAKYLAAAEPDYGTLTPERTLELMARPETSVALRLDRVGYVVLLSSETKDFDRHTQVETDDPRLWRIGRESRRTTDVEAIVFDTTSAVRAGELRLSIEGGSGWFVPVLLILPLPPIPYGSSTESKACKTIGGAIAEFLYTKTSALSPAEPVGPPRPQ